MNHSSSVLLRNQTLQNTIVRKWAQELNGFQKHIDNPLLSSYNSFVEQRLAVLKQKKRCILESKKKRSEERRAKYMKEKSHQEGEALLLLSRGEDLDPSDVFKTKQIVRASDPRRLVLEEKREVYEINQKSPGTPKYPLYRAARETPEEREARLKLKKSFDEPWKAAETSIFFDRLRKHGLKVTGEDPELFRALKPSELMVEEERSKSFINLVVDEEMDNIVVVSNDRPDDEAENFKSILFTEEEVGQLLGRTVELSEAALHQIKKLQRKEIENLTSSSEKRRVKHDDETEEEELFGKISWQGSEGPSQDEEESPKAGKELSSDIVDISLTKPENSQAFFLPARRSTAGEEKLLYPLKVVRNYWLTDDGIHARYISRASKLFLQVQHLGLSPEAEQRFIELAGTRYDHTTGVLKIVTSRHQRYQENWKEAKRLVRELLNEALLADPEYVPLKEYKVLDEADNDQWNSNLIASMRESYSQFVRPTQVPSINEQRHLEDVDMQNIMETISTPFRLFTVVPL